MFPTRHHCQALLGLALGALIATTFNDVFVAAGDPGNCQWMEEVDVAIVGAGVAGLMAAYKLEEAGYSVKVLEARNRICGRLENQPVGDTGYVVEGGGQWVGPTQDRVLALIDTLGLETFKTHLTGSGRVRTGDAVTPFDVDINQEDPERDALSAQLDELAAKVPLDKPWEAPNAEELDAMTFGDWVKENVNTTGGEMLINGLLNSALIEPDASKVSMLFMLYWLRSLGGAKITTAFHGGAQDSRVVGGTGAICDSLMKRLGDETVLLDTPVTDIIRKRNGAVVESAKVIVKAKRVVLTCQPQTCGKIEFYPGLPAERIKLQDALQKQKPIPSSTKLHFVYETPFWRDDGLSGFSLSTITGLCVDNSPPDGKIGVIMCFGSADSELEEKDYLEEFAVLYGPKAWDLKSRIVKDWSKDAEWTATCVTSVPPGVMTSSWKTIREPIGVLHFAGGETSQVWMGYIDGAVRSAEIVAEEIASLL
ncbi:hypothetical protein BSKO_13082 [Bryopsis sp. KO-2023]|nr:hypothetical protein BSKO_13082 [Bryopsis sp. KO-2023]